MGGEVISVTKKDETVCNTISEEWMFVRSTAETQRVLVQLYGRSAGSVYVALFIFRRLRWDVVIMRMETREKNERGRDA